MDTASQPAEVPSFFARIGLAFSLFFRVLFDGILAGRVLRLSSGAEPSAAPAVSAAPASAPAPAPPPVAAAPLHAAPTESALQLLGLLQREARFVDFVMEDMSSYSDADVGAAARVVHDQCKKALAEHVQLERVRSEPEGNRVTVPAGFSASEVRLVGNVTGKAPFNGVLTHAGWRASSITLPQLSQGHDVRVIAAAEVEL
jgi:hypothetical protein